MESDTRQPPLERRQLPRNRVATRVYVSARGQPLRCYRASNLSALGVFIDGSNIELKAGTVVTLVFPVPVDGVIRLHRKKAVVAHVSPRGAGLMMQGRVRRPRQF